MAFCASSVVLMVTKPKPRGRPVSRSIIMLVSVTVPCAANASCKSFSVVSKERFPTNNLLLIDVLLSGQPLPSTDCSRTPGLKSSLNRVHLKIHHALKETSYQTDDSKIAGSGALAIAIGNNPRAQLDTAPKVGRRCRAALISQKQAKRCFCRRGAGVALLASAEVRAKPHCPTNIGASVKLRP